MVNFPSKLPAPVAWVWGGLQPVTHWVQCSYSVCDQLSVSGWNEPICKKDSRDAHKIMRQITSGDTCISLHSASKKFLDILLVMILKITDRPLKKTLFFFGQLPWLRSMSERRWRGEDSLYMKAENPFKSPKKYLFLKSQLIKWMFRRVCLSKKTCSYTWSVFSKCWRRARSRFVHVWQSWCAFMWKSRIRLLRLAVQPRV